MTRALRIVLVANDGFSAGHVTRTLAIARALARGAVRRGLELATVLVTTSEADALLAGERVAVVRLPAPVAARHAGLGDHDRRLLVRAAIEAVVDGFGPDLIVSDTFPTGPHGELAGLGRRAKRALVRRAVPEARADLLATGLGDYDLAIVADDAGASSVLPIRTVPVPPITLGDSLLERDEARLALGLPRDGRAILVAAGGGGDDDAAGKARVVAEAIARLEPVTVALALGPLRTVPAAVPIVREPYRDAGALADRIVELRVAPLQRYLRAFDGAVSPAGYNTAHELAAALIPAALFAQPRPFDDQAARAARLARLGFARVLDDFGDDAIASALAWMRDARCPALAADGADAAAAALIELATGGARG